MKQKLKILGACIVGSSIIGFGTWYYNTHMREPITDFVYERDIKDVLDTFDNNWYWLMPEPKEEYPAGYVNYVFKYRAPQANPLHHNTLKIKVLHVDKKFAGFVAYHMKARNVGWLLFLAVREEFRGKKYGEMLARYAIKQLIASGATQINLVTRVDNVPAQRIYMRLGFREILRDGEGLVYFVYDQKTAIA
jgi:ribosomal protein S18 acetylase RimI-like enzyme